MIYNPYLYDEEDTTKQLKEVFERDDFIRFCSSELDYSTAAILYDKFRYNRLCSNERAWKEVHAPYWLKRVQRQYFELMRVESIHFDPMVSDYMEKEIEQLTSTKSKADTLQETNGSNKNTGTQTSNSTSDQTSETDATDETTGQLKAVSDSKALSTTLPVSTSYSGTAGGMPDKLNWQSPSQQSESLAETKNDSKETSKNKATSKANGTDTATITNNGEQTDNSVSTAGTEATTEGEGVTREIYSGRTGGTPAEILKLTEQYLKQSDALEWLTDQLRPLFMYIEDNEDLY